MRTLLLVAALALALFPTLDAFASTAGGCEDAMERLRERMGDSGGDITYPVALALRDAVEACRAQDQMAEGAVVLAQDLTVNGQEPAPPPAHLVPGPLAKDCGFTEDVWFEDGEASITVWRQVGFDSRPERDGGYARVTYSPATGLTTWEGEGARYGMRTTSEHEGYVSIHGVEIQADRTATAYGGCLATGTALCWGKAYATVKARELVALTFLGDANVCAA